MYRAFAWLEAKAEMQEGPVHGAEDRNEVAEVGLENAIVDVEPMPPSCPREWCDVGVLVGHG